MRRLGNGAAALAIYAASAGAVAVTAVAAALVAEYRGRARHPCSSRDAGPALRDAARALATAATVEEAIQILAEHAVASTRAFGAYVERIERSAGRASAELGAHAWDPQDSGEREESGARAASGRQVDSSAWANSSRQADSSPMGEVEVVAVAGSGCPPLGTRIPYPGSLTEEIIESGEPEIMTELGAIGEQMAPYLRQSCHSCSGLVVPLSARGQVLGAMVLLRNPKQGHFSQTEAEEARGLADLATAAFQRLAVIDELRESEARFHQLADHLEEVVWLGDSDLSAKYYVNPAYERIWGRSLRSFYEHPRSPIEAVHPEDRARVEAALQSLAGGEEYNIEYRITRPDGETRWVWSRGYPIRNERGEVYRVAGIMEDITRYKVAEQERERILARERAAQAEIATIIESITDAFITVNVDWTIVYANHEAEQLLDRTREELLGHDFWQVFPEVRGTRFEETYRRAMVEQKTVALEEYYPPIQRWLDVRAYPTADRLSIYYRDVTERKVVEADLRNRIEQLDALAALGQFALVETDLDALFTRVVEVTARELDVQLVELLELTPDQKDLLLRAGIGWREGLVGHALISASQESMAGYTLLSNEPLITEDIRTETRFRPSWILAQHGGVSGLAVIVQGRRHPWGALGAHTIRRHHFTGDDVFFLQSVSNILGQAIELRRVESERMQLLEREREARTEAERNRAEAEESRAAAERDRAELQRITESRARLMRGFSHDVKNPLGAADGFLQLMEEGILDHLTEQQREGVARARHAISEALDLIGDLLTIARAESGQITIDHTPTDLRATITAVVESFQARATTRGLTLTTNLPDRLPTIESDPDRIRQVLGNLLSNAVKYTEKGGVTVSAAVWEKGAGAAASSGVDSSEVASSGTASSGTASSGTASSGTASSGVDSSGAAAPSGTVAASDATPPPASQCQSGPGTQWRQYTPPGPGRWVKVDVADTGPGIPPEQQEMIFQEFGRADTRRTMESQGIGLYISQRIAQALGGAITVQSEVGRGSTFTLWLPAERTAS